MKDRHQVDSINKQNKYVLQILAVNPFDGKTIDVTISSNRIHGPVSISKGRILETAYLVPEILKKPKAIFQGVRLEEDEKGTESPGWLAYSGIPSRAFTHDGKEIAPYENEVFLVFVNADRVAYLWYWYQEHEK